MAHILFRMNAMMKVIRGSGKVYSTLTLRFGLKPLTWDFLIWL